jgi:hypothetical protein
VSEQPRLRELREFPTVLIWAICGAVIVLLYLVVGLTGWQLFLVSLPVAALSLRALQYLERHWRGRQQP